MTHDGRILVVAAVREELAGFRVQNERSVRCLLTGMGRRRAKEAVERCLNEEKFRMVVSTGFAGGTRPGFQVGDLVMASEVIDASSGVHRQPDRMGFGLNGVASVGPLVTVERLVAAPQEKAQIGARFRAIAVDLETTVVAAAAQTAQVPWVAVRVILDPMEMQVCFGSLRGGFKSLVHPKQWGELTRWVRDIRAAGRSLAGGLQRLVSSQLQ